MKTLIHTFIATTSLIFSVTVLGVTCQNNLENTVQIQDRNDNQFGTVKVTNVKMTEGRESLISNQLAYFLNSFDMKIYDNQSREIFNKTITYLNTSGGNSDPVSWTRMPQINVREYNNDNDNLIVLGNTAVSGDTPGQAQNIKIQINNLLFVYLSQQDNFFYEKSLTVFSCSNLQSQQPNLVTMEP